jgi:hypothetical protein
MRGLLSELGLWLAAIVAVWIALELGYRLGLRRQANSDEPDKTHANALHGAVLGLLALLLGFTFAMAVSRYENRKTLMVDQANAIGTVAVRARLLPAPYADQAAPLVIAYVDSRIKYNRASNDEAEIVPIEAQANDIETQLWGIAQAVLAADPQSQPGALFVQALNDMFDLREKRRFALRDTVPGAVIVLLLAVSLTSMALVSYSCGLHGQRRPMANMTFAVLIALVMLIIFDIDQPRQGFVTPSQESLIRLQQSLAPVPR